MISNRRGILQEGRFGFGGRCGMCLGDGYFWSMRSGGYSFYVGRHGFSGIDFLHPVAVCSDREIEIDGLIVDANDFWVAVRSVGKFGLESVGCSWVRIRGSVVPDQVKNVRADFLVNGRVRLIWDYEPRAGIARPVRFDIFAGFGNSAVDYGHVHGQVEFREGLRSYMWASSDLDWSNWTKFVIRAVSADGIDDGSVRHIAVRGDCRSPGKVWEFEAEMVREDF